MRDCVFCQIIEGSLPASVVHRDDKIIAFMDINPVNSGHVLVVPLAHSVGLSDTDEETGAHLFRMGMRVQKAIRLSGVPCEGINLFLADGQAAFQDVFHVHLHVFPRYKGDQFRIEADWSKRPPRDELDEVAARIRSAFPAG
ncbi:MAG TPA: HIT family protein [Chloroflexia bacterium]|nr:HIT family protein [Chloroflexia bacterium]